MKKSRRLATVFVELADTLVDEFDVVDFLQMLTERSVELMEADAAGLALADQRGKIQVMASTMDRAHLPALFDLQVDDGPCLECFSTGRAITNVDVTQSAERWPRFSAASVAAGFMTAHAIPLRLRGQVIGALNLLMKDDSRLDPDQISVAQAMADVATIGLLHERSLREQTVLSEQLQTALHSRVLIEQAKGVLSAHTGVTVDMAFTVMRAYARSEGVVLSAVAAGIVDGTLDYRVLRPPRGLVPATPRD